MKLKLALLLMVAASTAVQAQRARQREVPDDEQQAVTNEDRGRAYIISADSPALFTAGNNNNIIVDPQQVSVFLGGGWETAPVRSREPELANLLAHITDQTQLTALNEHGLKNFFAATSSQEKLDAVSGDRTIPDLEIQRVLGGMITENSVQRPSANTIYVIYLSPEVRSSLGEMIAGKHYLAYRNRFNAAGMKINYVVVPFEEDQKAGYQIALRAFLAAAISGAGS
jgi:hypothetical protein